MIKDHCQCTSHVQANPQNSSFANTTGSNLKQIHTKQKFHWKVTNRGLGQIHQNKLQTGIGQSWKSELHSRAFRACQQNSLTRFVPRLLSFQCFNLFPDVVSFPLSQGFLQLLCVGLTAAGLAPFHQTHVVLVAEVAPVLFLNFIVDPVWRKPSGCRLLPAEQPRSE